LELFGNQADDQFMLILCYKGNKTLAIALRIDEPYLFECCALNYKLKISKPNFC
jgi:hypothetical protein